MGEFRHNNSSVFFRQFTKRLVRAMIKLNCGLWLDVMKASSLMRRMRRLSKDFHERMRMMKKPETLRWTFSALFLALGFVLPFLTMHPDIGRMLLPMHVPVLLCGFVCGWPYGLLVGFMTPLLRSLLFGAPPMMPVAIAMAFELAAYGSLTGLFYARPPIAKAKVFISLLIAMLCGRLIWGLVSWLLYTLFMPVPFTLALFWADAFIGAWPGILAQWILVPSMVLALKSANIIPLGSR